MKIVLVVIAVVLVVLGGYSVWALTHPTTLRTEIEIPASPDAVWDVLADRDAYAEWNPFIRSSTGDLVVGRRIANAQGRRRQGVDVRAQAAGGRAGTRAALDREERGFGGIFDGEHAFRIEPAGPAGSASSRRRGSAVSRSPSCAAG